VGRKRVRGSQETEIADNFRTLHSVTDDDPRLSFLASVGRTGRRAKKVAAERVDELDRLPDEQLVTRFGESCTEVVTDDRGRRYEAEISVSREGRGLELTVKVADLPRRRTLVGDGVVRRDGATCGRRVLLYFRG